MLFIFKKKKIVLDCFTADPLVHKYYPVSRASNFKPKWFMDIPFECKSTDMGEKDPRILPTLRTCPGVIELLNKSIVIPLSSDLMIAPQTNGQIAYNLADKKDTLTIISTLPMDDPSNYWGAKHICIKINHPWMIKEKKVLISYQLLFSGTL